MLATYRKALQQLDTPETNSLLADLRRHCERIDGCLDVTAHTQKMKEDGQRALSISTLCSCRIDGITTADERLDELMKGGSDPKTNPEREIAGYRFTLNTIEDNYPYIHISTGAISQMHRDLYRYRDADFAGRWEDRGRARLRSDMVGRLDARLAPMMFVTKQSQLKDACAGYKAAVAARACDPLLATCMFVADFLNIHPFSDGNGRLSRLLTLLLLYQNGFFACGWVSLSEQIERTKPEYVKAIEAGRADAPEDADGDGSPTDYRPFVQYLLGTLENCCLEFERRYGLDGADAEAPLAKPSGVAPAETAPAEAETDREAQTASPKRSLSREERMAARAEMQRAAQAALRGSSGLRQDSEAKAPGLMANPPKRVPDTREERMAARAEMQRAAQAALRGFRTEPEGAVEGRAERKTQTAVPGEADPLEKESPKLSEAKHAVREEAGKGKHAAERRSAKAAAPGSAPGVSAKPAGRSGNEAVVREYFRQLEGSASKKEVTAACPGMSAKTVERMIQKFLGEGYIEKIGAARSTRYRRI